MRYWKPEDIFTVACPHCGAEIEFWKDEPVRQCSVLPQGGSQPEGWTRAAPSGANAGRNASNPLLRTRTRRP